jgi:hypothetical protein
MFSFVEFNLFLHFFFENFGKSIFSSLNICYRNLSLGLTIKVEAYNDGGQKGSLGITSHAAGSAKECERMNPHTPKELPLWKL